MLREIALTDEVSGILYRAPMPGSPEWRLQDALDSIETNKIDLLVCLAPMKEIRRFARRYAELLDEEALPCEVWDFPIPDGGLPDDEEEFFDLARDIAYELRDGAHVLIHCYAGIGRTGTMAISTLMALGIPPDAARANVEAAGAGPETYGQELLLRRAASVLGPE